MSISKAKPTESFSEIALKEQAYQNWLREDSDQKGDSNYERAKKALPKVMAKLTETQQYYLGLYFGEDLTMSEIAHRVGRNKATVSRTIQRALRTIYDYMSIISPEYASDLGAGYERLHTKHKRKT